MDPREFLDPENWLGSFYELAMEYAPYGDDERLLHAQQALWSTQSLQGPYVSPFQASGEAFRPLALPTSIGSDDNYHLYGVFHLPQDRSLGALSVIVREADRSDWLDFCLPTGMLNLIYPDIDYPLERATNPWMDEVDHVLVSLAEALYSMVPFSFALVGEEVSGMHSAGEISAGRLPNSVFLVPANVVTRLHIDIPSVVLPSGLHWFAPRSQLT